MMATLAVRRRAISYITAGGLAIAGGLVLANADAAQAQVMKNGDKVWVCKYVGKPGVDERLKEGKQPIEVGWRSADTDGDGNVSVGDQFADGQGRSIVVQINGPDPGPSACPPPEGPPSTTTSTTTSTSTAATTTTTTSVPSTTTRSTTTVPQTTTGTTPASTTSGTSPATTTSTAPSATTGPAGTSPATTPQAGGHGTSPGPGAPNTGGAGDVNPVNGLIGSGLLLAAAGVLANETLRRRGSAGG